MTEAHPSDSRFVLVPREVVTSAVNAMARGYERLHSLPRVTDTALADKLEAAKVALRDAALAAPGGDAEPVAWRWRFEDDDGITNWYFGAQKPQQAKSRRTLAEPTEVQPLFAAPPEPVAWRPTHRHVGRGGEYQVIGTATVQTVEGLCDYDTVTLYRDSEGLAWARHIDEFNDGRFVALTAPSPHDQSS